MASIVILSGGGIKSSVCAWRYARDNDLTLAHLSFGQAASTAELRAGGLLAESLPSAKVVPLLLPHVTSLQRGREGDAPSPGSAGVVATMNNDPERDALSPVMLAGVTPMMLAVGVQVALRVSASTVVIGLTRTAPGGHIGLPQANPQTDGRREMLHGMNIAFDALLAEKARITIEAPLMDLSYAEIVQLATRFDLALGDCWTCSTASVTACGVCEPCVARSKAFIQTRTIDPATAQVASGSRAG